MEKDENINENINKHIDIIVSRYNENLEWINEYPFNQFQYIVYNKGINDNFCKNNVKQIVNLPNIGREGHTYLYHIVENYNNLADIIIFFPGSININNKINKSKQLLNCIIEDNYENAYFLGNNQNNLFDNFKTFQLDNWQSSDTNNCLINPESKLKLCKLRPYGLWYKYFFGNITTHWVSMFGIFSIDKRDIIRHSVKRYKLLLNTLSGHSNPEAGHYIERSWGAIFYPMIYTKKVLYNG